MRELISTTVDEVDRLDQMYSKENKRASNNVQNRIGDYEKVLFCYYESTSLDILFYILTDVKLLYTDCHPKNVKEIPLNQIKKVAPEPHRFLGIMSGNVLINDGTYLFCLGGIKDSDFLQNISNHILKAVANFGVRQHSSTININAPSQNTVAEQLAKLADLHKSGILTDDEFKRAKERALSKN